MNGSCSVSSAMSMLLIISSFPDTSISPRRKGLRMPSGGMSGYEKPEQNPSRTQLELCQRSQTSTDIPHAIAKCSHACDGVVLCKSLRSKAFSRGAIMKMVGEIVYSVVDSFDKFYSSSEWRSLRYKALRLRGFQCQACGNRPPLAILHVDHIKPRSKHPELELDINNLQVLCKDCNLGKSNIYEDDLSYRRMVNGEAYDLLDESKKRELTANEKEVVRYHFIRRAKA